MKYMAALVKAKLDFELWIGNELGEEDACKMYQDTETIS